ncbi:TPR-like protein [Macrolepiota fuliginosa MF-IS2]|uniref:TPR-like protein n=1 Tax=Macrolepiota fuliginosa MF-IS2 TaxID=1400762 RepID=A0A9P5XDK0_9AGAR|nr:TPR-like protein [Macrolepiota fuliginosa MF-IS2]
MDRTSLLQIEKSFIRGTWDITISTSDSPAVQLARKVIGGEFRNALTSPEAHKLIHVQTAEFNGPLGESFNFSVSSDGDLAEQELLRLSLAVAFLHAFIQANWTGPALDFEPLDVITADKSEASLSEDFIKRKAVAELAYGGEPAYHLAAVPVFLRLSQLLLGHPYQHLQTVQWWRLRASLVHQQVLDEPVADSDLLSASLEPLESIFSSEPDLLGRLCLERGRLDHIHSQDKSAAEYFVKAARATGLEYELTGALGKRTKFQQTELSQLVLLAESKLNNDPATPHSTGPPTQNDGPSRAAEERQRPTITALPETLPLNDDTLLEQTEFTSSHPTSADSRLSHVSPKNQPPLHPIDQCIFLSLCLNVKNTSPSHGLTSEQMSPYVARVISHPRNWSVHTMALLLRSRLESSRTRTVERSTLQLQALIDQMPTSDSTLSERLHYFHSVPLPSKWELEKELAIKFVSLGVVKSALEIFERLEMWEEVVKCWGSMERPERGIAIVRDLLEGRKSEADVVLSRGKATAEARRQVQDTSRAAKLWCLLGDLEQEKAVEHYERAWSISKETSGRAMRSLGGHYFARGKYPETIACLRRAVRINPLLARSWFILGCACMRAEDWEGARDAFSRCVAIDEDDGESWSNLASMYLRLGTGARENGGQDKDDGSMTYGGESSKSISFANKMLAFRALKQGLRYSYENWRMWYNYMVVAMDVGELNEACRALGRVVEETSGKVGAESVDEDVLDRLVDAVTRASPNEGDDANSDTPPNPNEGRWLFKSVNNLFERVLLPRISSPRVFRAFARLLMWQNKWEEAIKAHLDAYRNGVAGTMEKGEINVERWREAVHEVEEIVDLLKNFGPRAEGYRWKLQARSIVRTFTGRTRDFEDEPEWERLEVLQDELRKEDE